MHVVCFAWALGVRIKDIPAGAVFYNKRHFCFVRTYSDRGAVQIGTGKERQFHCELDDDLELCHVYLRGREAREELEDTAIRVQ